MSGMSSRDILETAISMMCDGDRDTVKGYREDRLRFTINDLIFMDSVLYDSPEPIVMGNK